MAANCLPPHAYLVECFNYDPGTGILTWKVRPDHHFAGGAKTARHVNAAWAGKPAGVLTKWSTGGGAHLRVMMSHRYYAVHRVIWTLVTGSEPINTIDHRDRDGTNNRWSNLREATIDENLRNRRNLPRPVHPDLPKGVTTDRNLYAGHPRPYKAAIKIKGKRYHIGSYATAAEAHAAYCEIAKTFYRDFYSPNHDAT